jgi:hypothetical protein
VNENDNSPSAVPSLAPVPKTNSTESPVFDALLPLLLKIVRPPTLNLLSKPA